MEAYRLGKVRLCRIERLERELPTFLPAPQNGFVGGEISGAAANCDISLFVIGKLRRQRLHNLTNHLILNRGEIPDRRWICPPKAPNRFPLPPAGHSPGQSQQRDARCPRSVP